MLVTQPRSLVALDSQTSLVETIATGDPPKGNPVNPDHYSKELDPFAYALVNNLGFLEGTIIKYVSRYKKKGGLVDLEKARETLDRLIEWERYIGRPG